VANICAAVGYRLVFGGAAPVIPPGTGVMGWVYTHEALTAGLLGLIAAFASIGTLIWMNLQENKRWKIARRNQLLALKARLDLLIGDLNKYFFQTCPRYIRIVKEDRDALEVDACPITEKELAVIQKCIELADDPVDQELLWNWFTAFRRHQALLGYTVKLYKRGSNWQENSQNDPNGEPGDTFHAFMAENKEMKVATGQLCKFVSKDLPQPPRR